MIKKKEETLSLFHSLGKILYVKKKIEPEVVIEKSGLDCIMFNDLLYENFRDFFMYNTHFMTNKNIRIYHKNLIDERGNHKGGIVDVLDHDAFAGYDCTDIVW